MANPNFEWLWGRWLVPTRNKKPVSFKNIPFSRWTEYNLLALIDKPEDIQELINEVYRQGYYIAIWCKASKILGIDVDNPAYNDIVFETLKELGLENTYIEQTPRGKLHIVYEVAEDLERYLEENKIKPIKEIEFHWNHLLTLYGITCPDLLLTNAPPLRINLEQFLKLYEELENRLGVEKEERKEKKEEIEKEEKEEEEVEFRPRKELSIEELAEWLCNFLKPYYKHPKTKDDTGNRHNWWMGIAGLLRKKFGVPKDLALKICEKTCQLIGDNEIKDRLRAVEDTYKKPINEVASIDWIKSALSIAGVNPEEFRHIISELIKGLSNFFIPERTLTLEQLTSATWYGIPEKKLIIISLDNLLIKVRDIIKFDKKKKKRVIDIGKLIAQLGYTGFRLEPRVIKVMEKNPELFISMIRPIHELLVPELAYSISEEGITREVAEEIAEKIKKDRNERRPIVDLGKMMVYIPLTYMTQWLRDRYIKNIKPEEIFPKAKRSSISLRGIKIDVISIPLSVFGDMIEIIKEGVLENSKIYKENIESEKGGENG